MGEWSITFDVVWSLFYLRVTWRKISLSKDQTIAHINAYYLLPDAGNFSPIDLFCFSFSLLHKCSPQMSASIFTLKTENVFQACNWLRVFALEMMPLNVSLQIENIIVFHRPVTLIPQSAAIWWVFFLSALLSFSFPLYSEYWHEITLQLCWPVNGSPSSQCD